MRFTTSRLVLLAVLAVPSFAAIAHVSGNDTCKDGGSVTSTTMAMTQNGVAGNAFVGGVRVGAAGRTITITDSQGNTITKATEFDASSQGAGAVTPFIATNIVGGADTFTVSISGAAATLRVCAVEFSGISTTAATVLDVHTGATGNSTSPSSGTTATRAQALELLMGYQVNDNSGAATFTAGTGFTTSGSIACTNSTCFALEYQIMSVTGTDAATGTLSNTRGWGMLAQSFKGATGGSNPGPQQLTLGVRE